MAPPVGVPPSSILLRLGALLFLALAGCQKVYPADRPITVVFTPDVPQYLQDETKVGAKYWECVGVRVIFEYGGELLPVRMGHVDGGTAEYDGYYGEIIVDSDKIALQDERLERIAIMAHEIGHAVGMEHDIDPLALMHHNVPDRPNLYFKDVAQFDNYWGKDFPDTCPDVPGATNDPLYLRSAPATCATK